MANQSEFKRLAARMAEDRFHAMIEQLFTADTETKAKQAAQAWNEGNQLADSVDVATFMQDNNFDGRLFCCLTGQPVGTMDHSAVRLLIKTKSRIPSSDRLRFGQMGAKALHWVDTSNLTELAQTDPYGYYVYAASFCLKPFYDNQRENALEAQWKFHVQKIAMYQALLSVPSDLVIAANGAWRDFLAFVSPIRIKHSLVWPQTGAEFGSLEFVRAVGKSLRAIIVELLMKDTAVKSGFVLHAAQRLQQKFGGFANFRASARINGETDSEYYTRIIRSLGMAQHGMHISATYTGSKYYTGPIKSEMHNALRIELRKQVPNQIATQPIVLKLPEPNASVKSQGGSFLDLFKGKK